MSKLDYTYTFDHISEQLKSGQVRILTHATGQEYALQIAVGDDQLPLLNYQTAPPLLADLVDTATAVQTADRHSQYKRNMPRQILLHFPIRKQAIFNKPLIQKKLQDVLYWFTED